MNFIKNIIEKIKLWFLFRELEVSNNITLQDSFIFGTSANLQNDTLAIVEDEQQRKIREAVNTIKAAIIKKAQEYKSLQEYLERNPDLMQHAQENNEVKEIIKSSWDLRNTDNASEEDLKKIIERRIAHFYELQKYNEKRALIKQIKLAKKQGDMLTYNSLMKEWKQKYEIKRH